MENVPVSPVDEPTPLPPRRSTFAEWGALVGAAAGIGAAILVASASMVVNVGVLLLGGMAGVAVGAVLDWLIRGQSVFAVPSGGLSRRCFEVGTFVGLLWGIAVVMWQNPQSSQDWANAFPVICLSIVFGAGLGIGAFFLIHK